MVEIRDGFVISESKCLGISPGRYEFEIICSFCNGLIAIYNLNNQRFTKNWKLSLAEKLTTPAVYDKKESSYVSIKNDKKMIVWKHETEWVSDFIVNELCFEVHSLLATPTSSVIVYRNGSISREILNPKNLEFSSRNLNVSKTLYSSSCDSLLLIYSLSNSLYQYTLYQHSSNNDKLKEIITNEIKIEDNTVENFLDHSVRYFVTNKSKADIEKATMAKTPSGQSPQTPSTGGFSQLMSPYSNQSSSSTDKRAVKPRYYTRAQKILQKALDKTNTGTVPVNANDKPDKVLALATSWKCKILHVETVERELKKLRPVTDSSTIQKTVDKATVRKLRQPFFKFEDLSHSYRPVIYEPSHWPVINDNCPPEASPFDPPRPSHPLPSAHDNSKRTNHRKEVDTPAGNDRRLGYCEPCGVRFEDMEKHLRSAQHQEYASNPKNFEQLDKLISECSDLNDFLAKVLKQRTNSGKSKSASPMKQASRVERISLVSLPSTGHKSGMVVLSDCPVVYQSPQLSPGVCTRQMKKKLIESSPSLTPKSKRSRTF